MINVLIPMTNHATLGATDEANGTYAPELTHALAVFQAAGFAYQLTSITGGPVPIYGTDLTDDPINQAMLADPTLKQRLQHTTPVKDIDIKGVDAIFYPGGFGLLSDLATDGTMAELSAQHYQSGGIIAAVCHGPAGLLPITLSDGTALLSNKSVTGFTREEEVDFGTIDKIPYLLEESLTRQAKRFNKTQPWQPFVIEDGRLITGQNPASAHGVAAAVVEQIQHQTQ